MKDQMDEQKRKTLESDRLCIDIRYEQQGFREELNERHNKH